MGFLGRRQHKHYLDALGTLQVFERTHSFEKPEVHGQPELAWHQGDERRNWNDYQAFLGNMTITGTVRQSNVTVKPSEPAQVIELPTQPGPPLIELDQEAVAS